MRNALRIALLATLCLPAFAQSPGEYQKVKKLVDEATASFQASLEGVNPTQWNWKPPDRRHSIGELAEHAALSTNDLQRVIQQALQTGPQPGGAEQTAGKADTVKELLLNMEDPPDKFQSKSKLINKADLDEFYPQAKRKLTALLETVKDQKEPESCIYKHPSPKVNELNVWQWFYYIAYLNQSHTTQIEAIKQHEAYPKT